METKHHRPKVSFIKLPYSDKTQRTLDSEKQRMWLKKLLKKLSCNYRTQTRCLYLSCETATTVWIFREYSMSLRPLAVLASSAVVYWLPQALLQIRVIHAAHCCLLFSLQSSCEMWESASAKRKSQRLKVRNKRQQRPKELRWLPSSILKLYLYAGLHNF